MELDITSLASVDAPSYSASAAELGENAGQITWRNNVADAPCLLDTEEKREAFRDFVEESGGWTREEITAWNDGELDALLHQWIMGDVREAPAILEGITFREDEPGVWYHEDEATPDMETGPFSSRSEACADACPGGREPRAGSLAEIDWPEFEVQAEAGRISGRLYSAGEGTERKYYFYIGN